MTYVTCHYILLFVHYTIVTVNHMHTYTCMHIYIYIPCTGDEAVLAIRPCFRVTAIVRFQSTAFCSKGSLLFLVKFTHTPFTPNESHPFPFPARLRSKPSCWNPNEVKSSNKNYNFSFGNTCWYQMHVENNTLDQQVLITLHRHPCLAGRCQLVANKI